MEPTELLSGLSELAQQAGLRVRRISGRPARESEPGPASGVVRLRGQTWVILSAGDPVEERIEVVAQALRGLGPSWLESRYLPPALRARLEPPKRSP